MALPGVNIRGLAELSADGGFILSPRSQGIGITSDAILAKTDRDGALEWSYLYGGSAEDYFWKVAQTSDDGYIAVGTTRSNGGGNKDIFLVKTNADGLVASCCAQEAGIVITHFDASPSPVVPSTNLFAPPVTWNHSPISTSFPGADYCPAIPPIREIPVPLCGNDSFYIAGLPYTAPAMVIDYTSAMENCDTLNRYQLIPASYQTTSRLFYFCPGESLTIAGITYTQPAAIVDTIPSLNDCDTIRTTYLDYQELPHTDRILVRCSGQTITINGLIYREPAVVIDTLDNPLGCDTVINYYLQFYPLIPDSQTIRFCPGESVTIGNSIYTQPAIIIDTLPGNVGCDTLLTTELIYQELPQTNREVVLCTGQTITINDSVYNQPAVVIDTLYNPAGCDSLRITIILPDEPVLSFLIPDIVLCPGEHLTLTSPYSQTSWNGSAPTGSLTVQEPGMIVAEAYNESGCLRRDTVLIRGCCSERGFYIPNVFSPNDDGHNDEFCVYPNEFCSQYILRIYDRWGTLLFESPTGACWDGMFRGKTMLPGVYAWTIEVSLRGKRDTLSGDVTLIR